MIATILRVFWIVALVTATLVAWLSVWLFGSHVGPWTAGLAGFALVFAIHPALVAINFITSRFAGDRVPEAFRLSPWQAIKTCDAEIDASIRGFWIATPFLFRRPAASPMQKAALHVHPHPHVRSLAILFVHGYFCNRAIWLSFMRDAAERGYLCEALTLPRPFGPIESNASVVDAAIDDLLARAAREGAAADRVVIIAHSMGGLVVRAALQSIDASRIAHVITLGTPHHGAFTARYWDIPNVVQMRLNSPWLATLDAAEMRGRGLPRSAYTTLFSYHDNIVFPQETARLEGAHTIAMGGVGHVALVYDKRVRTMVFSRLEAIEASRSGLQVDVEVRLDPP